MSDFVILTDSSCDLPAKMVEELGVEVISLSLEIDGKEFTNEFAKSKLSVPGFYQLLRNGQVAKTSAANIGQFVLIMEPMLKAGKDILYLGFSSGLSATYNSGCNAARELCAQYPDRKIYAVDTLCASLGQGMLVYNAALKQKEGATLEEVRDYVEANKLKLCHWFTVDDLHFLKRGGRISPTTAIVGSLLNIKPVLHVDDEGHLISISKVRGRKAAVKALADHCASGAVNPKEQTMFICHGDCEEDAKTLAKMIKMELGVKEIIIDYTGPVIGSHSGPGTLALFYFGNSRNPEE